NRPADGSEYEAKQSPPEVLAFAYNLHINIGHSARLTGEGVDVARRAAPQVGVCRREDDALGIGPVVMQALPDPARAFRYISLRAAPVMHFEICIGAVAKELGPARSEIGESGNVLFRRCCGRPMEVNDGHVQLHCTFRLCRFELKFSSR